MNTAPKDNTDQDSPIARTLHRLDLRINPFAHLESSTDPNLGNYLVGHQLFMMLLAENPSIFFAPAGGGKTAAQIYGTRACWFGLGGAQVFPLPYHPRPGIDPTPENHLRGIARAGAAALFVGLIYRPMLFLGLGLPERRKIALLLDQLLPAGLTRYAAMIRSGESPQTMTARLSPSYLLPSPPSPLELAEFAVALEHSVRSSDIVASSQDLFEELIEILFNIMHFRAVLLQMDGVDASAETIANLQSMVRVVEWPIHQAELWAQRRVFLKVSLPIELEDVLSPSMLQSRRFSTARITWSPDLLAEVVRRRVYFASGEMFGSLDAVSSPALRDVEIKLARIAEPIPREVVLLANCLLQAYAARIADSTGPLDLEDIQAAHRLYTSRRVATRP